MAVSKSLYGKLGEKDVYSFCIENKNGCKAEIIERGATLDKLFIKDKNGALTDVAAGLPSLEDHINFGDNEGVTVGQYANRICGGKFSIDGIQYNVTRNEKGITCLHGGDEYSSAVWHGEADGENSAVFTYFSPDGKEGFPGNVNVKVVFTFTDSDELKIDYEAVSDKKTVINLTNHTYFNLDGIENGSILKNSLKINADRFTPIDETSIPTGELLAVKGTPFDFTVEKEIGRDIEADDVQLKNGNGFDHNFCISGFDGTLKEAASAKAEKSGIRLTVLTDLPGIQLYTGNFLDGSVTGKYGKKLTKRSAFCLETQVYPDSPNHPEWKECKCVFDAGEVYKTQTVFAFSVEK